MRYDARWYNERLDGIVDIMNKISTYSYIIYTDTHGWNIHTTFDEFCDLEVFS